MYYLNYIRTSEDITLCGILGKKQYLEKMSNLMSINHGSNYLNFKKWRIEMLERMMCDIMILRTIYQQNVSKSERNWYHKKKWTRPRTHFFKIPPYVQGKISEKKCGNILSST